MSRNGSGIRLASEADYTALGPVFAEVERFHREALPHIFRAPQGQFPPPLFGQWVSEAGSALFVADDADDLVGFVTVRTDSAPDDGILQPGTSPSWTCWRCARTSGGVAWGVRCWRPFMAGSRAATWARLAARMGVQRARHRLLPGAGLPDDEPPDGVLTS